MELLQSCTKPCTHSGRVMHICVNKLTIIGSADGLLPGQCQAIIWTNDGILSIELLGTNFSQIVSAIQTFSFKKMHLKISSGNWRPFCFSLSVLMYLVHLQKRPNSQVYAIGHVCQPTLYHLVTRGIHKYHSFDGLNMDGQQRELMRKQNYINTVACIKIKMNNQVKENTEIVWVNDCCRK